MKLLSLLGVVLCFVSTAKSATVCVADLFSSPTYTKQAVLIEGELADAIPLKGRHALVQGWELTLNTPRGRVVLVATLNNEDKLRIGHPYRFFGVLVVRTPEAKRKVRNLPEEYFVLVPCTELTPLEEEAQKGGP